MFPISNDILQEPHESSPTHFPDNQFPYKKSSVNATISPIFRKFANDDCIEIQ